MKTRVKAGFGYNLIAILLLTLTKIKHLTLIINLITALTTLINIMITPIKTIYISIIKSIFSSILK